MSAMELCNLMEIEPISLGGWNPYDLRKKCGANPLCYDFSAVTKFLKQPSVMSALGVTGHTWQQCNRLVNMAFATAGDWMKNYQTQIPDLLADGKNVLIYAGDQDFICNWLGNQAWTLAMDWPGKDAFNAAPIKDWKGANGTTAGKVRTAKSGGEFTFLQVHLAGHM